jgi:hypothetical protein
MFHFVDKQRACCIDIFNARANLISVAPVKVEVSAAARGHVRTLKLKGFAAVAVAVAA